jgi:hypothetical protein
MEFTGLTCCWFTPLRPFGVAPTNDNVGDSMETDSIDDSRYRVGPRTGFYFEYRIVESIAEG